MFSYNLCCRENSFVQLWHQLGPNQRELTHCLSVHIDVEGNLTILQGMPQKAILPEEPTARSTERGAQTVTSATTTGRPIRRSPRLRQNGGRYEPISPTVEEVRAFDALLHANMQAGKYDNSIHITIHVITIKVAMINR